MYILQGIHNFSHRDSLLMYIQNHLYNYNHSLDTSTEIVIVEIDIEGLL